MLSVTMKTLASLAAVQAFAGFAFAESPAAPQDEAASFLSSYKAFISADLSKGDASALASSCREDGSWPDVLYASKSRSAWGAAKHLDRVVALSAAFASAKPSDQERERLRAAIHRAIAFWASRDFKASNWWFNEIYVPRKFGEIAVLLGEDLSEKERSYLMETVYPRSKMGMTGQNKVWLAGNNAVKGALLGDAPLVKKASDAIWSELSISGGEGVQPDLSFHQHGAQLQIGNYGLAFANDLSSWGLVFAGSPWRMPPERLGVLRDYLLDGVAWTVWKGSMDISSCGRQLSPGSPEAKANSAFRSMRKMAQLDKSSAAKCLESVKACQAESSGSLLGNKHFWRSDYMIQRDRDFFASVKMCSPRVIGMESLNGDNLLGRHLADGVLFVSRAGGEFKDVFPLWNWSMLPGTTCAKSLADPEPCANWKNPNPFVGGASDGLSGCAAMDFSHDGVSARKSWFFGSGKVFCFASAVSSSVDTEIVTVLDQRLARGSCKLMAGGRQMEFSDGARDFESVDWLEHDGLRYAFAKPQAVHVSIEGRKGAWTRVMKNDSMSKEPVSGRIFSAWISHGAKPSAASCFYAVLPAGTPFQPSVPFSLSSSLHAARMDADTIGAVFWEPGSLELAKGRLFDAKSPCLAILKLQASEVFISDPTQSLKSIALRLDGKELELSLPVKLEAGRTAKASFRQP